ncbi:hypothetical protein MAR_015325 [Mya arenaria]|uniref:Uncharacterized protein n=1 Tax=Mya arenaria TaxID=6604 RepID=A0ABY7FKT8_MYAAR|nr:hypothetical protein MAR_015325 [Mya arenaria]
MDRHKSKTHNKTSLLAYIKHRKSNRHADIARYQKLKKASNLTCKLAYKSYLTNFVDSAANDNPNKFWTFVNNGIIYADHNTKAKILNDQFSSVFNKNETGISMKDMDPPPPLLTHTHTYTYTPSTGPNQVPTRLLKELEEEILTYFYQTSYDTRSIPEDWKTANAFDKVPHLRRLRKLNYYGIRGTSHQWIKDFMRFRTQQFILDGSWKHHLGFSYRREHWQNSEIVQHRAARYATGYHSQN